MALIVALVVPNKVAQEADKILMAKQIAVGRSVVDDLGVTVYNLPANHPFKSLGEAYNALVNGRIAVEDIGIEVVNKG